MDTASVLIILGIPVAYGLLIVSATLLAYPLRIQMVGLVEDILADQKWNAKEREALNFMLDSCTSFAIGMVLPLGIVAATIDTLLGGKSDETRLDKDERFGPLVTRYFASILAANPLMAIISVPLMAVSFLIYVVYDGASAPFRAVEEPLKKAAGIYPHRLAA